MKRILSVLLLISLFACLVSCGGKGKPTTTQSSAPQKTVYETLSELAQKEYSRVCLDIDTTAAQMTLHSRFVFQAEKVSYAVEQMNKLPTDGNLENIPMADKHTVTGELSAQKGQDVFIEDLGIALPSYDRLASSFDFNESYFENAVIQSDSFCADVIAPADFLGISEEITSLGVQISFTASALTCVSLQYQTPSASVVMVYTFET